MRTLEGNKERQETYLIITTFSFFIFPLKFELEQKIFFQFSLKEIYT